jgi:D-alanyl-D-alanine carboxypeptidase/D-alanyl-D-alanine-endopeptidase (penicillin-binding protein 4)
MRARKALHRSAGARRRWIPPTALAAALLASSLGAVVAEARATSPSVLSTVGPLGTPVLSVRRAPSVVAAPVADRRLRADLQDWASKAPPGSCAVVTDPDDDIVLDLRGEEPLLPASTQKLLTATAALLELGGDARFHTPALGSAPVDGVVQGDLTLLGGGDPILASSDYAARYERQPQVFTDLGVLAQRLAEAGVREVTGSVVGDEGRYDRQRRVEGWPERYVSQDVTGPLSALSVNDGFVEYPPAPDVHGELVEAPDPARQAAAVLTRLLQERGVVVRGEPRSGTVPADAVELAAVDSAPLTEIVGQMLRESDNSTAELLLKEIGRAALDPSTAGGRARATAVLAAAGVDLTGADMVDGSGLSLEDRVTCHLLVDLLERPTTGPVLQAGLAVAGRSGTLAERFAGSPLVGHLRAKTGTLNTVSGLAGLVTDADGTFSFAYLVNVALSSRVDEAATIEAQRQLGEILLSWPRVPDEGALGPRPAAEGQGLG